MTTSEKQAVPVAQEPMYLIRKGGYFYRPNAQGYTILKAEAGRYTLAEAISYSHPNGPTGPRDGIDYMLDDEPAPPKCPVCDDTKVVSQGGHDTGCNACYRLPTPAETVTVALPGAGEVELRETIADLEGQLEEALYQPWPKWAEDMKKQIRAVSGYDGYDDASDGVNLPDELSELINELTEQADKNVAEARASRKLDELERSVEHYRLGMNEWIATAQTAQATLATVAAANDEGVARIVLPPMPECDDRQPWEKGGGYDESDNDWCRRNTVAVTWFIDNHAAIRLLSQGGGK